MSRQVRDSNLETRSARSRLKVQRKPFFRLIEPGLHLGYRKLPAGPGTWVVRKYRGNGGYSVTNLRTPDGHIIIADDYADADSALILNFSQAQAAARSKPEQKAPGPYTVADAVTDYLRYLRSDGRSDYQIQQARLCIDAFVLPTLGKVRLAALTSERLQRWRDEMAEMPARLRSSTVQRYRDKAGSDDERRARRATVNRHWTTLRALLNRAFLNGRVDSDLAWRKVKPFKSVEAARLRYLTVAEAQRLINACDPDFRALVQVALQTGARLGELQRLQVTDFNVDSGTIAIRQSKSGKSRHVVLTDEGSALFTQLCAGRRGDELLLRYRTAPQRSIADACKRASVSPRISFHILRHTWASLSIMAGVPLMVVAKNLGHSSTRMVEKHYGHLAQTYVTDAIRAGAPRFGLAAPSVVPMQKRRH
jgi:integrase